MKFIEIVIKNLKCLKEIEIPIHNFNLLIGENDSGKSTVLDALNLVLNDERPSEDDFFKDHRGEISENIEIICLFSLNDEEQKLLKNFSYNQSELHYKKVIWKDNIKNYVFAKKYIADALNLNKTELNKKKVGDLDKVITDLGIEFHKGEQINKETRIKKILEFRENAEFAYNWVEIKKTGIRVLIPNLNSIVNDVREKFNEEIKKLLPYIKKYNETITDVAIKPDIDFSRGLKPSPIELKNKYGIFPLESKGEGTKKRLFLSFLEWDKEVLTETRNTQIIRGYDEPDTSLHYEAQRKLFYNIQDIIKQSNGNIQALICTHSLTMINRADPRDIYHLFLNDRGITNIQFLESYEDVDIESYLTELSIEMGLPNSSLFFERCFLIIEGETEEHCLPKLYYKKFGRKLIEDGICLVNIKGIGNAKGFIKLLRKNKENCLLFLLDNDITNPNSICRLTVSELKEIGFNETFIKKSVFIIGNREFEDSFKNQTIIDVLNTYWEKIDGTSWDENEINTLRTKDKFSKQLLIEVNKQSRKKNIDRFTKPKFGEKLGELCNLDDYPKIISKLFIEARRISKI